MRTIEAVGAQRKLITTNADVINYDLYNSRGVLLVDRQAPVIDDELLYCNELPFDPALREKYSVSAWVNRIFR
ncbi:hypothetical protein D3C77_128950 [compost metagenome]